MTSLRADSPQRPAATWVRLLARLLLGRRLPITQGTISVAGLAGEVGIRRDGWGVPHISAANDADAWFGLGFCHGQDRAFQLEATLRLVRGTLAAALGPDLLPVDRLARRIGFAEAATRQLAALSPEVRRMLDAYAAGVNAGSRQGARRRAHEFTLLRLRPTPWTAADAIAMLKLMSFVLATNWDVELARLLILRADGPAALAALDPSYPAGQPVTLPSAAGVGPALDRLAADVAALLALAPTIGGGSNNWALAASRTSANRPLLANDPHLSPALPPHWYLAHLRTPSWALAGASFVGAPTVAAGHNGCAAWGLTIGMTDNTDLFLEEVGADGRSVRQGDAFLPCPVRRERIAVKGRPDVVEEVLVTPRGPLIGPALAGEGGAVSLRAVWLDALPVEGLLRLHTVRSFAEFQRALAWWPGLPLNTVYADNGGAIGWQLAGQAPRRRKGNGTLPQAGWDPAAGWEADLLPAGDLPSLVNPAVGFVATANNRVAADSAEPFLTTDWLDGYRAARIAEALSSRSDWDLAATMALQTDVASLPWRELRSTVLAAPASDPAVHRAIELLGHWDGEITAGSAGAAVFELFVAELCRRLARAKAPHSYPWALGQGHHDLVPHNGFAARRVGHLARLLAEQPAGWLPRPWPDEVADALGAAVRHLDSRFGADPAGWAWGCVRPLTLLHPLGRRTPLDRMFNLGPIPWGGDSNTVAQAGVLPLDPEANPTFIASLRMVVDVGNWDASRFILPGGQSGNPLSPHYADQFPLWQRGEGIAIPWSEAAVHRATRATLRLLPRRLPAT
jgi:penicillin amidase